MKTFNKGDRVRRISHPHNWKEGDTHPFMTIGKVYVAMGMVPSGLAVKIEEDDTGDLGANFETDCFELATNDIKIEIVYESQAGR